VVLVSLAIPRQELNVVDSAVRAGIQHVVKIMSKASLDSPVARRRGQAEIEKGLIASGLGFTLLKNNAYMQNFLMMARGIADTDSFSTATGDGRVGHRYTRCRGSGGGGRRFPRGTRRKDVLADGTGSALRSGSGRCDVEGPWANDRVPPDHGPGAKAGDARGGASRERRRGHARAVGLMADGL